jgi:hypothetical protein
MDAPRQFRHQEVFCLRLAREASEDYVKAALMELAADYRHRAEKAERRRRLAPQRTNQIVSGRI